MKAKEFMQPYRIYLDDERTPKFGPWYIVRSYDEFVRTIKLNGMPTEISFDHDIASYDENDKEKTGLDAARFVVDYCMDNDLPCPDFNVHSANPIGAENIKSLLEHFKRYQNK
jgi:hypothetical protein